MKHRDLRNVQFVDVRMEDAVHEADAGRFVGVLIGKFDVHLPGALHERSYVGMVRFDCPFPLRARERTFIRSLETDVELLPTLLLAFVCPLYPAAVWFLHFEELAIGGDRSGRWRTVVVDE